VQVALHDVSVRRGRDVILHGVDLELRPGVTVLLGPNGAGKTTLLSALVGLLEVSHGRLEFGLDGQDVRRSLGFVPQEGTLPRGAALADVVGYAAWLQRVPRAQREEAVGAALAAMRLGDRARTPVHKLSGGMRRRALLACAIVHRPELLVLDEPTVGLDPEEQSEFRRLVREQGDDRIVVLSTHILDEAAEVADELVLLVAGRIAYAGPLDDLLADLPGAEGMDRTRALELAYLRHTSAR
jgi:ABC-2 type transport system ATP-binding protein